LIRVAQDREPARSRARRQLSIFQAADVQDIVVERLADPGRIKVGSPGHDHSKAGGKRCQGIIEPSRT
jgi:hypothetical protein